MIEWIVQNFIAHPELDTAQLHYSGHGVPDEDPEKAGALACADHELHCWELLDVINERCPNVRDVDFFLDSCGSGGAWYTAKARFGRWHNIKRIQFVCAVDFREEASNSKDGGGFFT